MAILKVTFSRTTTIIYGEDMVEISAYLEENMGRYFSFIVIHDSKCWGISPQQLETGYGSKITSSGVA